MFHVESKPNNPFCSDSELDINYETDLDADTYLSGSH